MSRRFKLGNLLMRARRAIPLVALASAAPAHASLFSGDTLDFVANILAWVVLVVAPIIAVGAFWIVHILPEQIAEKRHHPQAQAIKTLCLLSLVFGGMLWPFAWLWAYSKPVFHKMAYGTDVDRSHEKPIGKESAIKELEQLRARAAQLEAEIKGGNA